MAVIDLAQHRGRLRPISELIAPAFANAAATVPEETLRSELKETRRDLKHAKRLLGAIDWAFKFSRLRACSQSSTLGRVQDCLGQALDAMRARRNSLVQSVQDQEAAIAARQPTNNHIA